MVTLIYEEHRAILKQYFESTKVEFFRALNVHGKKKISKYIVITHQFQALNILFGNRVESTWPLTIIAAFFNKKKTVLQEMRKSRCKE